MDFTKLETQVWYVTDIGLFARIKPYVERIGLEPMSFFREVYVCDVKLAARGV